VGNFRGSSRRAIVTSRRKTAWDAGTGGTASTPVNSSAAAFIGSGLNVLVDGITAVRIRGYLKMELHVVSGILSGFSGAFGIGKTSLAAFTAGIASVPTPITEQGQENWLYWQPFNVNAISATIADGVNANAVVFETVIDSKAMRKMDVGDVLYAAIETVEVGTATMDVWHDSRILAKLP